MARPPKSGMDYFPHDTDASNDEKIEALRALYGNDGYAFYFILLERVYRSSNAELDISDKETVKILARKISISVERFQEILFSALKRGCFDEQAYTERQVLTSNGVKKRAEVVFEDRKIKQIRYQESKFKGVSPPVSYRETTGETGVSPPVSLSRESKEKNSKDINNILSLSGDKGDMGEKRGFCQISAAEITAESRKEAGPVWSRVLSELQVRISRGNFRTWLNKSEGLYCRDNVFVVGVPTTFAADYLNHKLRSLVEKTVIEVTREKYEVFFFVDCN
jgi:hypothetical protein